VIRQEKKSVQQIQNTNDRKKRQLTSSKIGFERLGANHRTTIPVTDCSVLVQSCQMQKSRHPNRSDAKSASLKNSWVDHDSI
jgi:hypothetical protein